MRGAFRGWDGLAPGSYVLTASASGTPPARSASVTVVGGATTRGVRIVVLHGGTVTGHVYDERHAPISRCRDALRWRKQRTRQPRRGPNR